VVVPLLFPLTTDTGFLRRIAETTASAGGRFLAAIPLHPDPPARQRIAQRLSLTGDDDRYAFLFHGNVEPLHIAAERHAAAMAHANGLADFYLPPRWEERSNWNASVLLSLAASRMFALGMDLDLAAALARSARSVAELGKPLQQIAASANLSIIAGVDETALEILSEWLDGAQPGLVEFVNEQWRLAK
jgi:hypothetical protein